MVPLVQRTSESLQHIGCTRVPWKLVDEEFLGGRALGLLDRVVTCNADFGLNDVRLVNKVLGVFERSYPCVALVKSDRLPLIHSMSTFLCARGPSGRTG